MTFYTLRPNEVAGLFFYESFPFKAEPYPFDFWRFDVKDERPALIASLPAGAVLTEGRMNEIVATLETDE